jgi:RNA polymerase sigma-70 factor (ECF subfamily)
MQAMEHVRSPAAPAGLDAAFDADRRFLGALCYRMTGSPSDAEDIVQETFVRALEKPPADTTRSWRPWLTRVALNLSRDHLRRRRRQAYVGPWLPGLVETDEDAPAHEPWVGAVSTEGRYDLVESISIAFLLALEALTPNQRAVLLLRDVFDYDVRETAAALDLGEANVKVTLLRARRAMQAYDRDRPASMREAQARTREALGRFVACLLDGDAEAVQQLLRSDAVAIGDGGGEYRAARNVVRGSDRVARLQLGLRRFYQEGASLTVRTINGLPALVLDRSAAPEGFAPRAVLAVQLDADGSITAVYSVLASAKLAALGV